ncbi:NUDIX domain-containing protein [Pseudonocardia sp. CA-107938]|uniref:NUDIX domain-containing protein n=1 Tax=Pseudonocardia sp. CA-107938 TaxID=3240021 RepID=UPI003D949D35
MTTISAGLLLHRPLSEPPGVELLLGHMGGPFFARKDDGAWSIPKGLVEADEDPLAGALREFTEELGSPPPAGPAVPLGSVRGRGKTITVFAVAGDFDAATITSNTFTLEWPPRSGRIQTFPEIDRAAWFDADTARRKLSAAQVPFVDRLLTHLADIA